MLLLLESSGLDIGVIDDVAILVSAPWTLGLSVPTVRSDLTQFKIETTNPVTYVSPYLLRTYFRLPFIS